MTKYKNCLIKLEFARFAQFAIYLTQTKSESTLQTWLRSMQTMRAAFEFLQELKMHYVTTFNRIDKSFFDLAHFAR
jgi:hypothetical protein